MIETKRAQYILSTAILWVAIFAQLLGILGVGMVWSVIITPLVLSPDR